MGTRGYSGTSAKLDSLSDELRNGDENTVELPSKLHSLELVASLLAQNGDENTVGLPSKLYRLELVASLIASLLAHFRLNSKPFRSSLRSSSLRSSLLAHLEWVLLLHHLLVTVNVPL